MGRKKLEQLIHYKNIDELKASADKGCHFCTHLWCVAEYERSEGRHNPSKSKITAADGKPVRIVLQISMSVEGTGKYENVNINIEVDREVGVPFKMNGRCGLSLKFFPPIEVDEDSQDEDAQDKDAQDKDAQDEDAQDEGSQDVKWGNLEEHGHDAQDSVSTASEASFDLARHWLGSCIKDHEACREECNSTSIIPSRLIDVGSPPEYDLVRLRSRGEFDDKPEYLTLSHCWGGATILRLLESNTELFFRSIPTEQLPKTFNDAITITRRLGYRYLWIDSICIVSRFLGTK
jgi:hypothetical protein